MVTPKGRRVSGLGGIPLEQLKERDSQAYGSIDWESELLEEDLGSSALLYGRQARVLLSLFS